MKKSIPYLKRLLIHWLGFGLLSIGLLGCSTERGPFYVPLIPKPTEDGYSGNIPVNTSTLWVEVLDKRENGTQIGQNVEDEDKPAIPIFSRVGDSPTNFVLAILNKQLKDLEISTVQTASASECHLVLNLTHFWSEEAPSYHANVRFKAEVMVSDRVVWRGIFQGECKRFGSSLSTDNYRETLSDATIHAINKMFSDPGFRTAINKK